MMKLYIILLLVFSYFPAFSQLKIEEKSKIYISYSESDLVTFINLNHFDYALMSWYTSNWFSIKDEVYCLFKQHQNWYLAIISRAIRSSVEPVKYEIFQRKLNKLEADSVWLQLNSEAAFKYTQHDFDKLPDNCEYQKSETEKVVHNILDAATYHLMQFKNKEVKYLYAYAPRYFLQNCYPYVKEYGILKEFVSTFDQLQNQTKNLKDKPISTR